MSMQQQGFSELTKEDMKLIWDFILLPVLQDVIKKQIQKIEPSVLKEFHIQASYIILDQVGADWKAIDKALRKKGIRVWISAKNDESRVYRYSYRGGQAGLELSRKMVKHEVGMKLKNYMDFFERKLRESSVAERNEPSQPSTTPVPQTGKISETVY